MDDRDTTEATHVGSKRKGDELIEPPAKKQKLISASSGEIISQALPEIPIECWEHIISFISCNLPVAIFVSRHWRRTYCRQLNRRISLDLSLSLDKVALLPIAVKRIYSKIDVYFLLDDAILAAKSRDFDKLRHLSTCLQKLSNMFIKTLGLDNNQCCNDGFDQLRQKYCTAVVFTGMTVDKGNWMLSAISCTSKVSSFFWFQPNGRYLQVNNYHFISGHSIQDDSDWRKLYAQIELKELGSDKVDFASFQSHATAHNQNFRRSNAWVPDQVEKIKRWLGLEDVDEDQFAVIFPAIFPDHSSMSTSNRFGDINMEREWSGQFVAELERTMRVFLDNSNGWAEEMEFVMNRITVKLTLMDRIRKDAGFSSENARDEFLTLIEHAKMKLQFFNHVEFIVPGSTARRDLTEEFMVILNPIDSATVEKDLAIIHAKRVLGQDWINVKVPSLSINTSPDDIDFDNHINKLIKLLGLKHVTISDLMRALLSS